MAEIERTLDLIEAMRTGMYVAYWAGHTPDAPALIGEQGKLTWAELNAQCNRLARLLRARGLKPGDALALLSHNSFEFVITAMATRRIGLRLTPINFHLGAEEVGYILRDCDAKAFVAASRFADVAERAANSAPNLKLRFAADGVIPSFESLATAMRDQDPRNIEDPVLGVNMLYTSGSTGKPKGVERPNTLPPPAQSASPTALRGRYEPSVHLHLCTGPLYHAAPLGFSLVAPFLGGAGIVLMDGWDAEESLRLIQEHRVTHTHMVPTMFHRMVSLPAEVRARYDLSSLVFVLHGAAPCPVPLKRSLIEWLGPVVFEYYGATEGVGTFVDSETWLQKPGTVGLPAPADQIRVLDEEGNDLPAGVAGTIYLKIVPGLRFRYYKDDSKTQAAFRGDYFTLQDVGYLDADGYLFLTDRTANLIISGGVNIYPAETEAVLMTHPAVFDVGVIGVPNAEWGEEVKAVVQLREGFTASETLARELIEYCRAELAHFKCPRTVDFVDKLPRFDSGKLYKHALRDEYRRRAAQP